MKKRILSILLVMVMIMSLFPAAAMAADSQSVLKVHAEMYYDGETRIDEMTEWSQQAYSGSNDVQFYLHHADGSTTPVDIDDLILPDFMRIHGFGNGWCRLETEGMGQGYIVYGDYRLPVESTLPNMGAYSGMPFTADTLIGSFDLTADNNVFYIALGEEPLSRGGKIAEIEYTSDNPNDWMLADVADIVISDDGSYVTVTVNDFDAEGGFLFRAILESDGNPWGRWGRGIEIINNMPKLYFCYAGDENGEWKLWSEDTNDQLWCTPGYNKTGCFFYATRDDIINGNAQPLAMDELIFPDYLAVEYVSEDEFPYREGEMPENVMMIDTLRFANEAESTDIVHTASGKKMVATTELPDIGYYTEPEASEDAFISRFNPFTVTETERSFYISSIDTDRVKISSVDFSADGNNSDIFELEYSTDANGQRDGRYVKITVKDDEIVENRFYSARVTIQQKRYNDQWFENTWWEAVRLENGQKTLMWRHMDWDSENQCWVESNDEFNTRMWLRSDSDFTVQFYYGFPDDYVKVDISDLTFTDGVLNAYTRDGTTWLKAVCYEGEGEIVYTDPVSGKTAKIKAPVEQPEFGLYSSPVASEATYLRDTVEVYSANDVFYIVADDDRTIDGIEDVYRFGDYYGPANEAFDIQIAPDGSYATIKLNKDADGNLPAGGSYELRIEQSWGIRYLSFELVRMDLPQLSTPTDLVWHKDYYWDAESANDYKDRTGAMSFAVGELFQNHCTVEIYSAADGYSEPVLESSWRFGDMNHAKYFSLQDFIYGYFDGDLFESGTYKFRIRANGDGTKYRHSEWSELSEAWTYVEPTAQLTAPADEALEWVEEWGMYCAKWEGRQEDGIGYYEVYWYYENPENGQIERNGGNFDIDAEHPYEDGDKVTYLAGFPDDIIEEHGNIPYYFKVRAIPYDISKYRISEWSSFSSALDTTTITDKVNDKLDSILTDITGGGNVTIDDVQAAFTPDVNAGEDEGDVIDTADLRLAMSADLSISGGASSGTLDLIKRLEATVADNVDQKVEAKNSAPAEIQAIASDIEMIGATLNLADKNPDNGATPTVTLEIDEPKEGIVIPEQQHNAVQFSMKLNGAIDKDDQEQAGQQLIVPVVIDMPVPEGINPWFLVVLHKMANGTIEQMWPNVYYSETEGRWRATFVIDSFSDFALVEYNFAFMQDGEILDTVTKYTDDEPFTIEAVGNGAGSVVTYYTDNPEVAIVDEFTGEVTIVGEGEAIIFAEATATDIYPRAETSYCLIVEARELPPVVVPPVIVPSAASKYSVKLEQADNGVLTADVSSAEEGTAVAVTATPADGYKLSSLQVLDKNGKEIALTDVSEGKYSFIMPDGAVSVKVVFVKVENPFSDVAEDAYYLDAVLWAVENGITDGTAAGIFSPNAECTRAQVVTFLWRAAGCPTPAGTVNPFADVAEDAYYLNAVLWAVENGITDGTAAGIFSPNAECTRAQVVTFLWRAQGAAEELGSASFNDVDADAYYADAVLWAVENGITDGTAAGIFSPGVDCTRAQVVTFLYRCMAE